MKRWILVWSLALCCAPYGGGSFAACDPVGTVNPGTVLYHGTPVGMFTWRDPQINPAPPFRHPTAPDGPAWFAANWQFSIHAGLRFRQGRSDTGTTLYRYTLGQQIAVLVCKDYGDFTAATGISVNAGDYPAASSFCRQFAFQYNGYVIRRDAVRGEPELILCAPSQVLRFEGSRDWFVTQVDAGAYTGGVGDDFGGQDWLCLLDNRDLGNFFCQRRALPWTSAGDPD